MIDERRVENHFGFGENWEKLVRRLRPEHLRAAMRDISEFMGRDSLEGLSFLDIGCGSGLSSIAAYRLGASRIISVDIDPLNVKNLESARKIFEIPAAADWEIYVASIVVPEDVRRLPASDIVYAWGVLHHTGDMWGAIDACARLVKPGGYLYLMLYRDAALASTWRRIKRFYTRTNPFMRSLLRNSFAAFLICGLLLKGRNPFRVIRDYPVNSRGMEWYIDVTDWVGGYPFEYASADEVSTFLRGRGFELQNILPKPDHSFNLGYRGTGAYRYLFRRPA